MRQCGAIPQGFGHAHHTSRNQRGIGRCTEQHHTAHMLAPETLAQHKGILRPDRDNQPQAQGQSGDGGRLAKFFGHRMENVHVDVANASDQVVQVSPDQAQHHNFHQHSRHKAQADMESGAEFGKGNFGRHRGVKHPNDEWQQQKHDQTADAVQDRHNARCG
jgi:hypothetical protein